MSRKLARAAVEPPAIELVESKISTIQDTSLDELKEKLEIERFRDDIQENLECCLCPGKTDRRLVILGSQITLSILIVLFCFFKLASSGEDDKVYITLLTSIFSYWSGKSTSSDTKG